VVRLDRRRAGAAAGLDHVRVQGALHEEARVAELLRLGLEHADELLADDLALRLGVRHPGQPVEEARLGDVTEPETKRKIIGEEFIRVFEEEAEKLPDVRFLVQGTLYSDVIESGGDGRSGAEVIKSHHNVGGLPEDLDLDLVEPLRMLFKDEVRAVGTELGLPDRIVWRQPFPGPGLGIRIVGGEVTRERLEILRNADVILQEEVRAAGLYRELWQSFCVLPVVRSVGVQGDGRSYAYPIVIRAVTSDDAMTADWARLPYDLLERVSNRIINEVSGVNRVALDVSSKPPATIEWE